MEKLFHRSNFFSFPQYFCYLLLDFHGKTGTRFSLRDKRLLEISEVEITRVDCISRLVVNFGQVSEYLGKIWYFKLKIWYFTLMGPASVAQLDARPTGDQEVAGSTSAGSATFFHGDWS